MNKQVMMLVGALSVVACGGSGVPWRGDGSDGGRPVPMDPGDPATGGYEVGGSSPVGGGVAAGGTGAVASTSATGGFENVGTGHGGSDASGGYEAGGASDSGSGASGGYEVGGASDSGSDASGGYEAGGTGYGGFPSGGSGSGGFTSGGTGSQEQTCAQSVTHCFDAAANCYEYSPWSNCDQIVDVCAAMEKACGE